MDNKKADLDKKTKIDASNDISDLENSLKKTKSEIDQANEVDIKSEEMEIQEKQLKDSTNSTLSSFKDTMELEQDIGGNQKNTESNGQKTSNSSENTSSQPEIQTAASLPENPTDDKEKGILGKFWDGVKEHRIRSTLGLGTISAVIYKLLKKKKKNEEESEKEEKEGDDESEKEEKKGDDESEKEEKEGDDESEKEEKEGDDKSEKDKKKESEKEKKKEKKKKKKKEKKEKDTPLRKKGLRWALGILGVGTIGVGLYKNWNALKGWLFEKLGKDLSIEEAALVASGEVSGGLIDESPFRYKFEDGIQYVKEKKTIKSYGRETKIDPFKKTIEGLDVVFPSNKELAHAANIVNCLKLNFHSRCYNATPFKTSDGFGGDLTVHLADNTCPECISASNTDLGAWIGGGTGCIAGGILGAYCGGPIWAAGGAAGGAAAGAALGDYLDKNSSMGKTVSTIAGGKNFEKFIAYLNSQQTEEGKSLWAYVEDKIETKTPIQDVGKKVLEEIKSTYSKNGSDFNRVIDIKQDENNPSRFFIESYNESVPLIIEGCSITGDQKLDYSKIKSIKIGKYHESDWGEGLEIDFSHDEKGLSEAIRTANLTNKIRKEFHGKGGVKYPFGVKMYGYHRHLQINDKGFRGRDVVYRETLGEKFPTVFEDLKKQINVKDQQRLHQQAYSNTDKEGCGSKYIKYLHQMREQNGTQNLWKKDNN